MKITISQQVYADVELDEEQVQDIVADFLYNWYWDTLLDYGTEEEINAFKEVYRYLSGKQLDTRQI